MTATSSRPDDAVAASPGRATTPQPFNPVALAWVIERARHVPVHKVANREAVENLARPTMVCGWTPEAVGTLVLAGYAREQLGGLFCVKCWRPGEAQ